MELRTLVRLSSEIISYYWPMRTFVHHNPLHGLEDRAFAEAVQRGQQRLGGNGYLSPETFRAYYRAGRILQRHLDSALRPRACAQQLRMGAREVTHLDVLRACMLGDVSAPPQDMLDPLLARNVDRETIRTMADVFPAWDERSESLDRNNGDHAQSDLRTMADLCDQSLGTNLSELINQ